MAKNEIRHVNTVLQSGVPALHSSLMACHHVKGHAVITTAFMPVSGKTLVLGSGDGARTLHNTNPKISGMVDRVAAQLGLLPHTVRGHPRDFVMALGADCEGHSSFHDGRS